jgi:hypothetical protein
MESELVVSLGLGFISNYFVLGNLPKWYTDKMYNNYKNNKSYNYDSGSRDLSLRFFMNSVWWNLWNDPDSWSSDTPKWKKGNFSFDDFLLGELKCSSKIIETYPKVLIPMPEKAYRANISLKEVTHKRKRWFTKKYNFYDIEMMEPIPFAGRGEHSWDQCDDALYSMSTGCSAKSIPEAIATVVKSVLKDRIKNSGSMVWNGAFPKEVNKELYDEFPKGNKA